MHRLSQGLPDYEEVIDGSRLVFLDDLLNEFYSRDACDLFTKCSHHRNISVILNTQNLFHEGRLISDVSLNAKYLVVFKNVSDENPFAYLAKQLYPEDRNGLCESCLDATRRPHGYLFLDLAQDTIIKVVYAPVSNETYTVELSPTRSEGHMAETAKGHHREFG